MSAPEIELAAGQTWRNARGAELRIGNETLPGKRLVMSSFGTAVSLEPERIRAMIREFWLEPVREAKS